MHARLISAIGIAAAVSTACAATATAQTVTGATTASQQQAIPEPPSWGAMEPGQGFEVVKTERGDLWISGDMLARYLNQLPADQTSVSIPAGFLLAGPGMARAQEPTGGDATELAKASQNPVGDLVSLPFQFNFNSGGAFEDRTFFNLNFQPVRRPARLSGHRRSSSRSAPTRCTSRRSLSSAACREDVQAA